MKNINHKEDFPLTLILRDKRGVPFRVPEYDFSVRLFAGSSEYFAGRYDGNLVSCRVSRHDPCALVIFCNDHGLPPTPVLMAEITYFIPDADYPDNVRRVVRTQSTDICLTVCEPDLPGRPSFGDRPPHCHPGHHPNHAGLGPDGCGHHHPAYRPHHDGCHRPEVPDHSCGCSGGDSATDIEPIPDEELEEILSLLGGKDSADATDQIPDTDPSEGTPEDSEL